MSGDRRARKALARQSLFELPLESIKAPLLVVGHAAYNCERSPAELMENITSRTQGAREQVATVTGGPINPGRSPNPSACEVREPHDFIEQEAETAAGIMRFIRGGKLLGHQELLAGIISASALSKPHLNDCSQALGRRATKRLVSTVWSAFYLFLTPAKVFLTAVTG